MVMLELGFPGLGIHPSRGQKSLVTARFDNHPLLHDVNDISLGGCGDPVGD